MSIPDTYYVAYTISGMACPIATPMHTAHLWVQLSHTTSHIKQVREFHKTSLPHTMQPYTPSYKLEQDSSRHEYSRIPQVTCQYMLYVQEHPPRYTTTW